MDDNRRLDALTSRLADAYLGRPVDETADEMGIGSLEEALAVQLAVLRRVEETGCRRIGWKVGHTSGLSRDSLGAGVRPFGWIVDRRLLADGSRLAWGSIRRPVIETELCLRLGHALRGPAVRAEDVQEAVVSVAPAFELIEGRVDPAASPWLKVADDMAHWGIVLGPEVPLPRLDWSSLRSVLWRDDVELAQVLARDHIDDHFRSLALVARQLSAFGLGLERGDLVITGSFTKHPIDAPGRFRGAFEGIGEVSLVVEDDRERETGRGDRDADGSA